MGNKGSTLRRKNKIIWTLGILLFAAIIAGGYFVFYAGGDTTSEKAGDKDKSEGTAATAPWANKLVDFQVLTSDKYTGSDEAATMKVFDVKPGDWDNPRGTFTDSSLYTQYTASSGVVTVNKEMPGHYYLVGTVSGSNTEFMEIDIPDGTEASHIGEKLSDYNTEPDSKVMELSAVGSTTDEDYAFTLTNQTAYTVKDTLSLTVGDDTELRGWKVIVDDTEGYSVDTDGDGVYDEGIKSFELTVCGVSDLFFKPANGIDKLDSNDEYTMFIKNCNVEDGDDISVKVEIVANTGDYTGANDEVWGEGEGVLAYIKIYDQEGNLFATSDVAA